MNHPNVRIGEWIEQALEDADVKREAQMMKDARDFNPNEFIERELAEIERLERKCGDSK